LIRAACALAGCLFFLFAAELGTRFDLRVTQLESGDLRISWSTATPEIATAGRATLDIRDANQRSTLDLTPAQLRLGSSLYRPSSGEVIVRLEVGPPSETPLREYVFYLCGPLLLPVRAAAPR
jgi:hypothetical protein